MPFTEPDTSGAPSSLTTSKTRKKKSPVGPGSQNQPNTANTQPVSSVNSPTKNIYGTKRSNSAEISWLAGEVVAFHSLLTSLHNTDRSIQCTIQRKRTLKRTLKKDSEIYIGYPDNIAFFPNDNSNNCVLCKILSNVGLCLGFGHRIFVCGKFFFV